MIRMFQTKIARFVRPDGIEDDLRSMHPDVKISRGRHERLVPGTVRDIEWNHLDQSHRVYIHIAYHDSVRVPAEQNFAYSLVPWKKLRFYVGIFDARLERGLFYQVFNAFGLIHCHFVTRLVPEGENVRIKIKWFTAPHKSLGFLQGIFNHMVTGMQTKRYREDLPIRCRRHELRKLGFELKNNEPDFLNANTLDDKVIFPLPDGPAAFPVERLAVDRREKVTIGPMDFDVLRTQTGVQVWPVVCPHEGARIREGKFCGERLEFPWHGREFHAINLAPESGRKFRQSRTLARPRQSRVGERGSIPQPSDPKLRPKLCLKLRKFER